MKPKIFCFVNSGRGTDMQMVLAIAEDGTCLASHCSSHELWAQHDIGLTSDWKHDIYVAHYPNGFELEWVDEPATHTELLAAHEKNQAKRCGSSNERTRDAEVKP